MSHPRSRLADITVSLASADENLVSQAVEYIEIKLAENKWLAEVYSLFNVGNKLEIKEKGSEKFLEIESNKLLADLDRSLLEAIQRTAGEPSDQAVNKAIKDIKNTISLETKELVSLLVSLQRKDLLRVCQKSYSAENFLRNNIDFNEAIKKKLDNTVNKKSTKHPSMKIQSMDNEKHYDVLDLYIATFFNEASTKRSIVDIKIDANKKLDNKTALNYACQLGLFDAFLNSNEVAFNELKKNVQVEENIQKIFSNNRSLSNLYYGAGYIEAGCRLFAVSEKLAELSDSSRAKAFKLEAIKSFLCAAVLDKDEYSNSIINNLTLGKGVSAFFDPFLEANNFSTKFKSWTGWSEMQELCSEQINAEDYKLMSGKAVEAVDAFKTKCLNQSHTSLNVSAGPGIFQTAAISSSFVSLNQNAAHSSVMPVKRS